MVTIVTVTVDSYSSDCHNIDSYSVDSYGADSADRTPPTKAAKARQVSVLCEYCADSDAYCEVSK